MNRFVLVGATCTMAALYACSAPSTQPQTAASQPESAARPARHRHATGSTVYVIGNSIAAYDTATLQLLRTYTQIQMPGGAVEDASGNLYVSDSKHDAVVEFAAGQTRIVQTFTQGMSQPTALAFDASQNLYVANDGPASSGGNSVSVFDSSGGLLRTITQGIQYPTQLAFDSNDNLFVSNLGGPVSIYADGGSTQTGIISQINGSTTLLLDPSDDVYVADCNFHCAHGLVYEFGPDGTPLLRKISNGIRNPYSLALDGAGNLFVADANVANNVRCFVTAYAQGATSPYLLITDGVFDPHAVGVDGSGNLYVANYRSVCAGNHPSGAGSVTVYPSGGTSYSHKLTRGIVRPTSLLFGY